MFWSFGPRQVGLGARTAFFDSSCTLKNNYYEMEK